MKFTCTRENFRQALETVSPLAGKHAHLPILANILIQASEAKVEIISTNLEVAIKTLVRAKVEKTGSFTVPAKMLTDFVHLLEQETVDLEVEGIELIITSGSTHTKIKGMLADEFPVLPEVEEKYGYVVDVGFFKDGLQKTVISVAKNEIRPELSGVFFRFSTERYNGLLLAATDSYRLSETHVPLLQNGEKEISCIVPARVVYETIRLLGITVESGEKQVRLFVGDNQIALRYGMFEMSARLIQGRYPDYAQIIPTNFKTTAQFPVDHLINKIKAASLFTVSGINAVSFDLNASENTIGVSSASTQAGEHSSELEAEIVGEENSILLNHRYVLDGLQHIGSGKSEFCVNSGDAPCLFRPIGNENFLYIVMPIRQ